MGFCNVALDLLSVEWFDGAIFDGCELVDIECLKDALAEKYAFMYGIPSIYCENEKMKKISIGEIDYEDMGSSRL